MATDPRGFEIDDTLMSNDEKLLRKLLRDAFKLRVKSAKSRRHFLGRYTARGALMRWAEYHNKNPLAAKSLVQDLENNIKELLAFLNVRE